MRRIWRPVVWPPELSRPGRPGYEYARKQREGAAPRDKFVAHWRSADVRGVLNAMCGAACAYCCDVIGRPGEDVEHYRPKNLYWFLAYDPSNYLSSCRRCNSSRKIDWFPLEDGAVRAADGTVLRKEKRLLLDPVTDDVEAVMHVELTSGRYTWEIDPAAPSALRRRAEHTIAFFRLNTDPQLLRARIEKVQEFLVFVLSADRTVVERARRMASRFQPHGAALRSVLAQQNAALLPSLEEEVQWWLTGCVSELQLARDAGAPEADTVAARTYSLAALWADPPRGITRRTVQSWYDALAVREVAEPAVALLRQKPGVV